MAYLVWVVSKAHAGAIASAQACKQICPIVEGNNVERHQSIVDFTVRIHGVYEDIWLLLSKLKHY